MKRSHIITTVVLGILFASATLLFRQAEIAIPPAAPPAALNPERPPTPQVGTLVAAHDTAGVEPHQSQVDTALAALNSTDHYFVRDQFGVVEECLGILKQQEALLLIKSNEFPHHLKASTEKERSLIIAAATSTLDSCREFSILGVVKLKELRKKLLEHGLHLNAALFQTPQDPGSVRRVAASLMSSRLPRLIELGAQDLIRTLPQATPQDSVQQADIDLWDRAILIAGCLMGQSCDKTSRQAANMCWQTGICDTSIDSYWKSDLDAGASAQVSKRAVLLVNWFSTASEQQINELKDYAELARAVEQTKASQP